MSAGCVFEGGGEVGIGVVVQGCYDGACVGFCGVTVFVVGEGGFEGQGGLGWVGSRGVGALWKSAGLGSEELGFGAGGGGVGFFGLLGLSRLRFVVVVEAVVLGVVFDFCGGLFLVKFAGVRCD